MRDLRRLRSAVAVLGVSYFALWACAPIAANPPPAPMAEGRQHELGLTPSATLTSSTAAAAFGEQCSSGFSLEVGCGGPSLAAHWRFSAKRFDLTSQVFAGTSNFLGANVRVGARVVQTEKVFVAPTIQAGWLAGGVSVYTGVALSPQTWLVLTPTVQTSAHSLLRGSAGLWHTTPGGAVVGFEVGGGTGGAVSPWAVDAAFTVGAQLR